MNGKKVEAPAPLALPSQLCRSPLDTLPFAQSSDAALPLAVFSRYGKESRDCPQSANALQEQEALCTFRNKQGATFYWRHEIPAVPSWNFVW